MKRDFQTALYEAFLLVLFLVSTAFLALAVIAGVLSVLGMMQ